VRERQIVQCVCEGKLNKEIAHELHLAVGTVKAYMSPILGKVGVRNRTQLALWAVRASTQAQSSAVKRDGNQPKPSAAGSS
jgi:DNA-binding NarL/FixJ family response regulator